MTEPQKTFLGVGIVIVILGVAIGVFVAMREIKTTAPQAEYLDVERDRYYEQYMQSDEFKNLPEEEQYYIRRGGSVRKMQDDLKAAGQ